MQRNTVTNSDKARKGKYTVLNTMCSAGVISISAHKGILKQPLWRKLKPREQILSKIPDSNPGRLHSISLPCI